MNMPIPQLKQRRSASWKENKQIKRMRVNSLKNRPDIKKKLIKAAIYFTVAAAVFAFAYVAFLTRDLPNPNQLIEREIAQSTKIYDRSGEHILYEISGEQKRTLISLTEIPDYVKQATIAIEDKNYYKHGGFSIWAMFRTSITNVIFNRSAGGSTLTQQFIKNAVLTPEKRITRKIKELVLSYRLEQKFSKDEILQMYLNEIPYGSNAYGVEAASQKYFGKSVRDVDLAESAILAAIIQAPSRYSPYGANKDLLFSRKDYVLSLMEEQGYISQEQKEAAQKEELKFKNSDTNIIAPHFVMYVKDILADRYGEKTIEQGGLKIYTTLDIDKQTFAEEVIKERTKDYPEKYGAENASLVALDPKTGQILAMVGSRDFFDDSIDGQVNIATRPRQPGSSMKPIVYATLFGLGYNPDTILYDTITDFSTDPSQPYIPQNYNGQEYGPVSIRKALAGSLNIPAVKAIYLAGIDNVLNLASHLGYSTFGDKNRFGLAFVLGGAEVKLLEHVNAYSAFSRDGQVSEVTSILKVVDKDGKTLEEAKTKSSQVLDSQVARMINSILSDNEARSFIFSSKNYLNLGERPVAAKTGTTNDYHDAWTVGYTPSLVAGVWVGNNNNRAMKAKADGSVVAAPIWHDFMLKALGKTPIETFKAPDDYKTGKEIIDGIIPKTSVLVDVSTGLPASSSTPAELISEKIVPNHHCILYYVNRENPLGGNPENPGDDPQFKNWEASVEAWAKKNNEASDGSSPINIDTPSVNIISPAKNSLIDKNELDINIQSTSKNKIAYTEYFINGILWENHDGLENEFKKDISFLNNGYHSLLARVCDEKGACGEALVDFNLVIANNPGKSGNNLSIIEPRDGANLSVNNFPLRISLSLGKIDSVYKIDILARNLDNNNLYTIKTINNPREKSLSETWEKEPPSGNYQIFANLSDWNEGIITSNQINVKIE